MEQIVTAIAAKVAGVLVEPVIFQAQCLFCVNKFIRNLEKEKEELISKRDSNKSLEKQAIERTEIIEDAVKKWFEDVESQLEEVRKLEEEERKESLCFHGWCPTWSSYFLCLKMAEKIKTIRDLKAKGEFMPFSHPAPLPGIEYISSQNFTCFESTKVAYNQLLEALQDDNAYLIGLYGMGGSGKTTLATEVGKKALELGLFDRVIPPVTISQTPNIRSIQGKMADMLNLKLEEESEEGRAQRLWLRLKEERVLIIVDDIWTKFDLEKIGILLENNNKPNLKVLLTTREIGVCDLMNCQRKFLLNLLSDSEAWSLFNKHAGIGDESSFNLLKVAREVSDECKGLPIAIEAVGSSLKGKGDDEWKVALESLRHSEPFDDREEESMRRAFTCLKLSYDYLRNKEAKMIFLMCSMFPEDHQISIEDLVRYGVGLGLYRKFSSFDSRRSRIKTDINQLVYSCLLLHSGKRELRVKMHDVVRDVALRIASSSEDTKILVNLANDLNALAENGAIKDYFAISSWYRGTDLISYKLDAPKLEILLLEIENKNSLDFSFGSLEGVMELKVISIINHFCTPSLSLSQSIQWLTNLRTFCLRRWNLGDLSFLISLTRLEALDLQWCHFKELPKGIEKLKKLKLLDLSYCEVPENFNYEALGSFSQLEELYAFGNYWKCPSEVIKDIVTLTNLQRFQIQIEREYVIPYEIRRFPFSFEMFKHYRENTRVLGLQDFNLSSFDASNQNLLQKAYSIRLDRLHGGCKNVIPDMVQVVGGMNELTNLYFSRCSEIEHLIDTTYGSFQVDTSLPKLVKLELSKMDSLKEVCRGPPLPVLGFFQKLEQLFIRNCQQLHGIFPEGFVLDEDQLNHFISKLKKLELQALPQLKFIWSSATPRQVLSFHSLQSIKLGHCPNLKSVFSMGIERSLPELTYLMIYSCEELEEIMAENEEPQILSNTEVCFPKLTNLVIRKCNKLKILFSVAIVGMPPQISTLHISEAAQLEVIFTYSSEGNTDHRDQIMLPNLRKLRLEKLPSFVNIFQGFNFQAPKLLELSTNECPKFGPILRGAQGISFYHTTEERRVFCLTTATWSEFCEQRLPATLEDFLNLEVLHETKSSAQGILHLQVEREIIGNTEWKPLYSNLQALQLCDLPELRFIWNGFSEFMSLKKLRQVSLADCPKLKTVFSPDIVRCLPNLQYLSISNCEKLEEIIFSYSEDAQLRHPSYCLQQEVCFPRLSEIEVKQCNKLKCLFYDFKACLFPELRYLTINECSQLEQTVGIKIEVGDKSFQREVSEDGNLTLFQKLRNLRVMDCPKYRITSSESRTSYLCITTQKGQVFWLITTSSSLKAFLNLEELHLTKSRAEGIFQLQVEGETSNNPQRNPWKSNLTKLELCDLPELRFIWNDFPKFLNLGNFQNVSLVNCPKLKTIFSPWIVRCLPMLKRLLLSNCEELEEIMSSNSENAQITHPSSCPEQQVCFPQLYSIEVKQCNKLKCLFSDSMACHFPEMKSLEIEECSQLEQVFGFKGKSDDESSQRRVDGDGNHILFPKLDKLVLKSLPIFFEISSEFNLQQPLNDYLVTDCPKYRLNFSEGSTSCQHNITQGESSDGA